MYDLIVRREKKVTYLGEDISGFWSCQICHQGGTGSPMFQIEFLSYMKPGEFCEEFVGAVFCLQICKKCKEEFFDVH